MVDSRCCRACTWCEEAEGYLDLLPTVEVAE